MNVLELVADYPNNSGNVSLMFVHTRNKYYQKAGINPIVLNFKAKERYSYDGILVITLKDYLELYREEKIDVLILHAPNIRNHYLFLKRFSDRFKRMVFFYHGHEVLKINKVYSKPYSYIKTNELLNKAQDLYDNFKLSIWRHYLPKVAIKSDFIFVSQWMFTEFKKWTQLSSDDLNNNTHIIYNSVGKLFEEKSYDDMLEKEYDFITIRSNLDGSKYCIDIINELAKNTPEAKFLVVGNGAFFDNNRKAGNITLLQKSLSHLEIVALLNKSRFALMPTRTDAQGLMMCEMAAFGIPVITSDIPVCREVLGEFNNVYFINNDKYTDLGDYLFRESKCVKDTRFFESQTVQKEIDLLKGQKIW